MCNVFFSGETYLALTRCYQGVHLLENEEQYVQYVTGAGGVFFKYFQMETVLSKSTTPFIL